MIDWLYQTTLSLSLLIGLVLIIRKPVSKYLGANIVYWLWIIPLIRFFSWNTSELPVALVETVDLLDGKILIRVIDNHNIYGVTSLVTFELVWVLGLIVWLLLRTIGWLKFQNNLKTNSSEIDIVQILPDAKALINNSKASFYMTDIPQAPFVTGLISSRIYLPKESFKNYNKIQKICILKHELTHLQRKDLWVQILVEIIRAIFWFNPIVHIAWSAFRHDQELACDYQVLAKSNKNERHAYGQALLTGLSAHVLPSTMAFFTHHKQRFIMLEKHTHSRTKNIFGIAFCVLLTVFALTNAPTTIAVENKTDQKISFRFKDIDLKSMMMLVADAKPMQISGYENVPDIKISVEAIDVSAQYFEILLLKCSGLKMVPDGEAYKIIKNGKFDGTLDSISQCVQNIQPNF